MSSGTGQNTITRQTRRQSARLSSALSCGTWERGLPTSTIFLTRSSRSSNWGVRTRGAPETTEKSFPSFREPQMFFLWVHFIAHVRFLSFLYCGTVIQSSSTVLTWFKSRLVVTYSGIVKKVCGVAASSSSSLLAWVESEGGPGTVVLHDEWAAEIILLFESCLVRYSLNSHTSEMNSRASVFDACQMLALHWIVPILWTSHSWKMDGCFPCIKENKSDS